MSDPLPEMIYSGYLLIRRQIEVLSVEYLNDLHPKHKIYMFSGLVHVFSFSVFVCLWMAHVEQSDSPSFINWRIAAMITTSSRCVLIIFAASYVYLIFILSFCWNFTKLVFLQLSDGRRRCSTKVLIRLSSCFLLYTLLAYFYSLFFVTGHSPIQRSTETSNSIVCPTPTLINLNGFTFRFLFFIR